MTRPFFYAAAAATVALFAAAITAGISEPNDPKQDGWISLFDGKSLDGWQVGESPDTFRVEDGCIVVSGPRAHLFYTGPALNHSFTNFEFEAEVKTATNSNSGMYFATVYQESGWPSKGYEAQVNNSHKDWRRTGGLYGIVDVTNAPAADDEWFTQRIRVEGKRITISVNGKVTADYTEQPGDPRPKGMEGRWLAPGTVALQGHDPVSKVWYRNLRVRALP